MNTPSNATHVFYSPAKNCIIDTCTDEQPPRSHINRQTLTEMQERYPDVEYLEFEKALKIMTAHDLRPVQEITEKEFEYALECLPPVEWIRTPGEQSFKMSEHWRGNVTEIYASLQDRNRFFVLRDDFRLGHRTIIARCWQYIENSEKGI